MTCVLLLPTSEQSGCRFGPSQRRFEFNATCLELVRLVLHWQGDALSAPNNGSGHRWASKPSARRMIESPDRGHGGVLQNQLIAPAPALEKLLRRCGIVVPKLLRLDCRSDEGGECSRPKSSLDEGISKDTIGAFAVGLGRLCDKAPLGCQAERPWVRAVVPLVDKIPSRPASPQARLRRTSP